MACFGDLAPITTIKRATVPSGFKVMRVNTETGETFDFAVNRMTGPASKLPHDGFERPSHCQFGPDGALYIVDFGIIHITPERSAIRQQVGTGALWRIRRAGERRSDVPRKPIAVPVNYCRSWPFLLRFWQPVCFPSGPSGNCCVTSAVNERERIWVPIPPSPPRALLPSAAQRWRRSPRAGERSTPQRHPASWGSP